MKSDPYICQVLYIHVPLYNRFDWQGNTQVRISGLVMREVYTDSISLNVTNRLSFWYFQWLLDFIFPKLLNHGKKTRIFVWFQSCLSPLLHSEESDMDFSISHLRYIIMKFQFPSVNIGSKSIFRGTLIFCKSNGYI